MKQHNPLIVGDVLCSLRRKQTFYNAYVGMDQFKQTSAGSISRDLSADAQNNTFVQNQLL